MKREGLPIYGFEAWRDGQGRIRCGALNRRCEGAFGVLRDGIAEFPDGWHRELDGVWRLSHHAQRRADRNRAAQDRRLHLTSYERPDEAKWARVREDSLSLPIVACCPRCGHRNLLDTSLLEP